MDFSALLEGIEPVAIERVPAGFPNVRFAPESDRLLRCHEMTLWATIDQSAPHQGAPASQITANQIYKLAGQQLARWSSDSDSLQRSPRC